MCYFSDNFFNLSFVYIASFFLTWMDYLRLLAVSLFSWTVEQNTRDTQMTTERHR